MVSQLNLISIAEDTSLMRYAGRRDVDVHREVRLAFSLVWYLGVRSVGDSTTS
jgi:hypothetical protein